nr:reverse transcriptase domain-containing protein [Tanacetum cinerariifolium]
SVEGGGPKGTDDREETPPPLTKEQIEGHVSALKSLIKSHIQKNKGDPICLDFKLEDTEVQDLGIAKRKEVMDEDLGKPFKEARRTLLTRRIIEFAGPGEWPMPVWCRMFQQTLDGSTRGWFERLPHDNINEWADLRKAFASRYSVRRACFKEPHEITKIVGKANESLTAFKERWTVETGFIMGVPEVMKISSFMDSVKSPELAKRFSNKVPTTVNEMMERLNDFVRSEEAHARTELPKGEVRETHRKTSLSFNRRDNRLSRNTHPRESRRNEYRNNYRSGRDAYLANRTRDDRAPYPL